MMVTMYDSIEVSEIPSDAEAVAGYVGGHWPTYSTLVSRFPKAHRLSIAVNAGQHARCLDVEPGDATAAQAPTWFHTFADHSQGKPVLYTSAAMLNVLIKTMQMAQIGRDEYLIWSAHYSFKEHICGPGTCGFPQADATQWTDKALGRNLDQSLCSDQFFGTPKPPSSEEDVVALAAVVASDGNLHVFHEDKNGNLWYTWQKKGESNWHGGQQGKSVAGLTLFAPAPK